MDIKEGYYRPWVYGTPAQIVHILYIVVSGLDRYSVHYGYRKPEHAKDNLDDNDREVKALPTAAQAQVFLEYLAVTILEMTENDPHWAYLSEQK